MHILVRTRGRAHRKVYVCACGAWAHRLGWECGCCRHVELMLVSAYAWEVGLWPCTSRLPAHTHTRTHAYTPGYPDTYRHMPAPLYRHTSMCRHVLTLVCRLPVFLSVFLCWGQGGSRNKMFRAALEDGLSAKLVQSPRLSWFPVPPGIQGCPD